MELVPPGVSTIAFYALLGSRRIIARTEPSVDAKSPLGGIHIFAKTPHFDIYWRHEFKTSPIFAPFSVGSAKMPRSVSMTESRSEPQNRGRIFADHCGLAAPYGKGCFIIAIIVKKHFTQLSRRSGPRSCSSISPNHLRLFAFPSLRE